MARSHAVEEQLMAIYQHHVSIVSQLDTLCSIV